MGNICKTENFISHFSDEKQKEISKKPSFLLQKSNHSSLLSNFYAESTGTYNRLPSIEKRVFLPVVRNLRL